MTLLTSYAVIEALMAAMTIEDLRHIVALLEERRHVPSEQAQVIAEGLAAIVSAEPIDTELGPIPNRPTVGFYRRWWPEGVAR